MNPTRIFTNLTAISALTLISSSSAFGILELYIDTDREMFYFEGSAIYTLSGRGILGIPLGNDTVIFSNGLTSEGAITDIDLSGAVVIDIPNQVNNSNSSAQLSEGGIQFSFQNQLLYSGNYDATITGSGEGFAISYSSLSPAQKTAFESMAGESYPDMNGLGPELTVTAVPEPSTYTLLMAIVVGGVLVLRRRKLA
ncbi:MAG: PEP-CTERM sorting domain-containing protein [Puniceicoccales bacterium]